MCFFWWFKLNKSFSLLFLFFWQKKSLMLKWIMLLRKNDNKKLTVEINKSLKNECSNYKTEIKKSNSFLFCISVFNKKAKYRNLTYNNKFFLQKLSFWPLPLLKTKARQRPLPSPRGRRQGKGRCLPQGDEGKAKAVAFPKGRQRQRLNRKDIRFLGLIYIYESE